MFRLLHAFVLVAVWAGVVVVLGNVAAKGAQLGYRIDIAPPEAIHPEAPVQVPDGYLGLVFPIHVAEGERIEMVLFLNKWGF